MAPESIATPQSVVPHEVFTIVSGPLVTAGATVGGEGIQVSHSVLDAGLIENLFDGNRESLIRGETDNPFVLELRFPKPRPNLAAVSVQFASMDTFKVKTTAKRSEAEPVAVEKEFIGLPGEPLIEFEVPGDRARPVEAVRLEILDRRATPGEGYHLHLRELALKNSADAPAPSEPRPAGADAPAGADTPGGADAKGAAGP